MRVQDAVWRYGDKVSGWNRARKWRLFLDNFNIDEDTTTVDIGFSPVEYKDSDNYIEKHYPYPDRLTALTIEDDADTVSCYPEVTLVHYDGVTMPFESKSFDIAWSNAVLEHVGTSDEDSVQFLREMDRIADHHWLTTPNRWFPLEVHTRLPLLHWTPPWMFDRVLQNTQYEWATGDYMRLLSRRKLVRLLHQAGITDYRIQTMRVSGLPMDYVVIW